MNQEECICALATPAGGAIGIIRLSGNNAITITDQVFTSASGKPLTGAKANTLHYGEIKDKDGKTIDDVLVSVFRAPHSYTGEDSTEISCHGSRYILQQVLLRLTEVGCRQAEPGEYTRRAYMNGKMDLSQAEAVADLIASTNKATHHMAMSQLKGHFSNELTRLREKLLKMTSLLELELDFSDHEELEFADRSDLRALAEEIERRINTLAHSFETGNAIKQGVPVAIVGKTNVGKSTLLNRLLHEEKAIVSDIHGTTRDVIEDTTLIDGITFRFIDTAGIRGTDDTIESLGIERTFQKIRQADIVLWVIDSTEASKQISLLSEKIIPLCESKQLILVFNKADLSTAAPDPSISLPENSRQISISAREKDGISSLQNMLVEAAQIPSISQNDIIVSNVRHYEALTLALDSVHRVQDGLENNLSGDFISQDLRECIYHLSDIVGEVTTDEVLGNIFRHFCIGK